MHVNQQCTYLPQSSFWMSSYEMCTYPKKKVRGRFLDGFKSSQNKVFELPPVNSKSIFIVKHLVSFHWGQIIKGGLSRKTGTWSWRVIKRRISWLPIIGEPSILSTLYAGATGCIIKDRIHFFSKFQRRNLLCKTKPNDFFHLSVMISLNAA